VQALRSVLTPQTYQAQAGALTLVGVGAVFHLPAHHGRGGHSYPLAPGSELGRCLLQVRPVRGRHVLRSGGVRTLAEIQDMSFHAFVAMQNFERARRDAQPHHLAHQGVGHGVVVAVEFDVVIDVDAGISLELCPPSRGLHRHDPLMGFIAAMARMRLTRPMSRQMNFPKS